jgi:hypothetical protein
VSLSPFVSRAVVLAGWGYLVIFAHPPSIIRLLLLANRGPGPGPVPLDCRDALHLGTDYGKFSALFSTGSAILASSTFLSCLVPVRVRTGLASWWFVEVEADPLTRADTIAASEAAGRKLLLP